MALTDSVSAISTFVTGCSLSLRISVLISFTPIIGHPFTQTDIFQGVSTLNALFSSSCIGLNTKLCPSIQRLWCNTNQIPIIFCPDHSRTAPSGRIAILYEINRRVI